MDREALGKVVAVGTVVLLVVAAGIARFIAPSGPSSDKELVAAVDSTAAAPVPAAPREPAPIAEYALTPYTQDQFPKTFRDWGEDGVAKIEEARRRAAAKAALSPECDSVEIADLSDRSSAPNVLVIWVDCANARRFYFSESDLENSSAVESETAKGSKLSASDARETCWNEFRAGGRLPSTFNYARDTSVPRFFEPNGRWVVEAMPPLEDRAIGAPRIARCIIPPGAVPIVDYID